MQLTYEFYKEGDALETDLNDCYLIANTLLEDIEFRNMLSEEGDDLSAVIQITAGAGGTESCDWASMLMRMYLMWAEKQGYKIKYFPEIIVYHLRPVWKNKEYIFKGKGALFARLYGNLKAFFLIYFYAILKYRHSENIIVDLKNMINEVSNFKN